MKRFICILLLVLVCGCSHNSRFFLIGERSSIGLDPQSFSASFSRPDGVNVIDVARENTGWRLSLDNEAGFSVSKDGTVKGVKSLEAWAGPQITGYLVELARLHPEFQAKKGAIQ